MTILQQKIKELREQGKSYNEISTELKCSKATVAYNCSADVGAKARRRSKRYSTRQGALYKKLQGFCYNYGKKDKNRYRDCSLLDIDVVTKLIGPAPTCYLTGDAIDLKDMASYSLDHIIPLSKGGKSDINNLGLATKAANQAKSDLTKEEFLNLCIKVLRHNNYTVEKN